jgi:hypothetical protein
VFDQRGNGRTAGLEATFRAEREKIRQEAERDDLLHGAAVNRVRRAGERVVKEAEAHLKNAAA